MSWTNHEMLNGKLIQTNKRFFQLKINQKEKIGIWILKVSMSHYTEHRKVPKKKQGIEILWQVYDKIQQAKIWIPFYEFEKQYYAEKFIEKISENYFSARNGGCLNLLTTSLAKVNMA